MMPPRFVLRLAKEDFKFSAAHFTVFSSTRAEELHGHNYRVRLEIVGGSIDELGLMMEVGPVKAEVRRLCADLDSKTLLPERSALVRVSTDDGVVEVRYGPRVYRLPEAGVRRVPIRNTSIEELALYFWRRLASTLEATTADELAVEIEETAGQSCRYIAALRHRGEAT